MNKEISIKYNNENFITNAKAIVLVGLTILILTLSLFYKTWLILIIGTLPLVLVKIILGRPDGEMILRKNEDKLILIHQKNKVRKYSSEVISQEFSWNYIHEERPIGYDAVGETGHGNYIQLKLQINLKNEKKILIHEKLLPWRSTPENWNYKIFDEEKYTDIFIINGDLDKVKNKIEKWGLYAQ